MFFYEVLAYQISNGLVSALKRHKLKLLPGLSHSHQVLTEDTMNPPGLVIC